MAKQGRIADITSAKRQERMYARTKPVTNADKKEAVSATFSEIPCWTRSTVLSNVYGSGHILYRLTGICLNPSCHLSCANMIEESNILPQNCLEITFSNAFGIDFSCVNPNVHVRVRTDEQSDTCKSVNFRSTLSHATYRYTPIRLHFVRQNDETELQQLALAQQPLNRLHWPWTER